MNLIKSLSIVMIFVVIPLGVAEFGLRLIFPQKVSVSVNVLDHSDPYLPKIAEGEYRDDKLDVVASFDSDGFRRNPFEWSEQTRHKAAIVGWRLKYCRDVLE
jgi:hypothetical protein